MVKCILFGHRTHKMIDFELLGNIKIIMIMAKFGIYHKPGFPEGNAYPIFTYDQPR